MINQDTIIVEMQNGNVVGVGHLTALPYAVLDVDQAQFPAPIPSEGPFGTQGVVIPNKEYSVLAGNPVSLTGTISSDFDQSAIRWGSLTGNPSIGNSGSLESVTFTFMTGGVYRVLLTARSRDGLRTAQDFTTVTVS